MDSMKLTLKSVVAALVGMLLFVIVPSESFGEPIVPVPVHEIITGLKSLHMQNEHGKGVHSSRSGGFRAEESDGEDNSEQGLSLQRSLSAKKAELIEMTDASGGTMIRLQGRFQCGLKTPPEPQDSVAE